MDKELIPCPKDPRNQYFPEYCEEIFRKGNIRYWCKECPQFKKDETITNKNNQ